MLQLVVGVMIDYFNDKLSDLENPHKTHKTPKTHPHKTHKTRRDGLYDKTGLYANPVYIINLYN